MACHQRAPIDGRTRLRRGHVTHNYQDNDRDKDSAKYNSALHTVWRILENDLPHHKPGRVASIVEAHSTQIVELRRAPQRRPFPGETPHLWKRNYEPIIRIMTQTVDRLAMRGKPEGSELMSQNWEDLLFMHWSVEPAAMRQLVPAQLELDTFDGKCWLGITPFRLTNLHLKSLPAIPGLDSFLEVNVRTYVVHNGVPGIYFFSLDASKAIPAMAARTLFTLPYFKAEMDFKVDAGAYRFHSTRATSPASLSVEWTVGKRLRDPHSDSLAFFLVERYCFFAVADGAVMMTRVYHHPWILEEALLTRVETSMMVPQGIPELSGEPITHFSHFLDVDIWPPKQVG